MAYYKVTEWKKQMYRITSAECVYMDLIVGEDRALLLDTGWGLGDLHGTVREITDKPLIVVNSHGHVDHVAGNLQFTETIYIHPKDMELCKAHGSVPMRQYILAAAEPMGILPEGFDKEKYLEDRVNQYETIEEGQVFDLGNRTLEVVELPGHTVGSIGLYCPQEKVLYVADAITSALLLSGPEAGSLADYRQTLQKAQALDFVTMMQGHGDGVGIGKERLSIYEEVTQNLDWDKAFPYKDGDKESPNLRIVCREGQTQENLTDPDFACIVISKDKIEEEL